MVMSSELDGLGVLGLDVVDGAEGDGVVVLADPRPAPGDGVVVVPLVQHLVSLACSRTTLKQKSSKYLMCSPLLNTAF